MSQQTNLSFKEEWVSKNGWAIARYIEVNFILIKKNTFLENVDSLCVIVCFVS